MTGRYARRLGLALRWASLGSQVDTRTGESLPPAWTNIPEVGKDVVLGVLALQNDGRAIRLPTVPRRSAMSLAKPARAIAHARD